MLKRLKVDVNSVYQRVESLSGGRQQSVAIARAISFDPRVVILDEPTANLSVMATERLLETMLELKKHGVAQIIISHRLQDIFAVGDRVMVLKRGENVGDRLVKNSSEHEVLGLIVSGDPGEQRRPPDRRLTTICAELFNEAPLEGSPSRVRIRGLGFHFNYDCAVIAETNLSWPVVIAAARAETIHKHLVSEGVIQSESVSRRAAPCPFARVRSVRFSPQVHETLSLG